MSPVTLQLPPIGLIAERDALAARVKALEARVYVLEGALGNLSDRVAMLHKYADDDGRQEIQAWQIEARAALESKP